MAAGRGDAGLATAALPTRVVIEAVAPQIDGGRFPTKRLLGEPLIVQADIFTDGHDALAADLQWQAADDVEWRSVTLHALVNDRWEGRFTPPALGRYRYRIAAWVDRYGTWRRDTEKKLVAELDLALERREGVQLLGAALPTASAPDVVTIEAAIAQLEAGAVAPVLASDAVAEAVRRSARPRDLLVSEPPLTVRVDPPRAGVGAWYELFPRSLATEPGGHGTLADCRRHLAYVAELGFDVVYLPPIHPIGERNRKGRNNTLVAEEHDPGSPWAIGSADGGHDAIHPELGTGEDLRALVDAAREVGLDVALDLAFQCAPDHPWVRSHPEWFRHRPDGSIQYAENPPKRYEDIYPFDFENDDWRGLWGALLEVVEHWIDHGIRIFRVDNPHTKPFRFWEWLIDAVSRQHPDVVFLAEAFTRPKVMHHLAKAGFSQSYTYFAWRQTKWELVEYLTELTRTELADYFRPNFWPNTPDILTEQLQIGTRSVFVARLVLAAMLSASYGIYGPAYELMEHVARPGSEEYLDNEKYEIRTWDLERADSLRHVVARVNQIRRSHPALGHNRTLRFHHTDNDALVCWSKSEHDPAETDPGDVMIMVVNLDPHHVQSGWIDLDLAALGIAADTTYQVHDELGGARHLWHGSRNYVELDPGTLPAHAMAVRRHVRTEHDFDYFM